MYLCKIKKEKYKKLSIKDKVQASETSTPNDYNFYVNKIRQHVKSKINTWKCSISVNFELCF